MKIEIPENHYKMIDLRQRLAATVTLSPEHLALNRLLVDEGYKMEIEPLFTGRGKRPLMEHLSALRTHLGGSLSYPVSARLLSAGFLLGSEAEKFYQAAIEGLRQQESLGSDIACHMFAHQFDIWSGIITAAHGIIMVEDELNGLTLPSIERRNQMAEKIGIRLPPWELAVVYGESTAYAKELTELLDKDQSDTPGSLLFTDLILRVESGQFVPGILPESFRELVILGVEDSQRIYERIYPVAEQVLTSS